jgi:MFS family permease
MFIVAVVAFFIGFNMHEPIMQSLTAKYAKVHERGKVLGLFNSFGYFGTFLGAFVGGLYFEQVDGSYIQSLSDISTVLIILSAIWLLIMVSMANPHKQKNIYLDLDSINSDKLPVLDTTKGVEEWYINNTENIAVVKYDEDQTDPKTIETLIR